MSSKILFGVLGTTAATATIAAPATLLSGGGTSIGGGGNQRVFHDPTWVGRIPGFALSTDIKEKYRESVCLKEAFKEEIEWTKDNQQLDTEPSLDFKNSGKGDAKGCLIVEYHKEYINDNTWWGGFRLIWTVSNNEEGLITVFNSKTKDGSFKFDSAVYIVGKKDQKWSMKYQQENPESIFVDNEIEKKFPSASNSMFNVVGSQENWGFGANSVGICKVGECKVKTLDSSEEPMKWNWQKNSSGKSISEWCENFDNWFDGLLGNNKNKWSKVKETLKELKGTWTRSN